jgi:hypothetical protein
MFRLTILQALPALKRAIRVETLSRSAATGGTNRSGLPVRGVGGGKAPSSMGEISTAEVLRLRATSAVSRDPSVRRSAQDDESAGI